jgi:hypothetical protein
MNVMLFQHKRNWMTWSLSPAPNRMLQAPTRIEWEVHLPTIGRCLTGSRLKSQHTKACRTLSISNRTTLNSPLCFQVFDWIQPERASDGGL